MGHERGNSYRGRQIAPHEHNAAARWCRTKLHAYIAPRPITKALNHNRAADGTFVSLGVTQSSARRKVKRGSRYDLFELRKAIERQTWHRTLKTRLMCPTLAAGHAHPRGHINQRQGFF